ncbi:ABC transporter substrate-binding protein [Limnochorda pilosa]|uniref:ABC transporter substrate-binding protein n=2 Tax=Limnochorda pilosa TaxID=1555112 RepID=A0A0K2SHG5_LIMPI|nr:ABC transporter substrate-binding protein [Limnochorda pilosa]
MKRGTWRDLLLATLCIMAITLSAAGVAASGITVVSEFGIHTEAWKTRVAAFTEETAITVNVIQYPYANYLDQLTLNFTGGRPNFDVAYISGLWYPSFATAGYITPLDQLFDDPADLADIPGLDLARQRDHIWIAPYMNEIGGIAYRRDLFEDPVEKARFQERYGYELRPPQTLREYRDVAEFFHRPPDLYGVTLMGRRSIFLATHFMNRLWARGGTILDEELRPAFDGPDGVAALEETKAMFQFANPAARNYDFQEALTEFEGGRSAMAELWTTGLLYADDPSVSTVVGKASFARFPQDASAVGQRLPALYIFWGFAVSSASPKKDAAFKFVEFMTRADQQALAAPGRNIPSRLSALDSPRLRSLHPWLAPFQDVLRNVVPTPLVPLIPEGNIIMNEYLVPEISAYIAGEKPAKQALDDAAGRVERLLRENGYYD